MKKLTYAYLLSTILLLISCLSTQKPVPSSAPMSPQKPSPTPEKAITSSLPDKSQISKILYQSNFDDGKHKGWEIQNYGGELSFVKNAEAYGGSGKSLKITDYLQIKLNLDDSECRGKRLKASAMIKVLGKIIPGKNDYESGKFHISWNEPGRPAQYAPNAQFSRDFTNTNNEWMPMERETDGIIPENASGIHIVIGIQVATGTIMVDNVKVEVLPP